MQKIEIDTPAQTKLTILRRPAVEAETGEGRSTLYERMAQGLFPRPIKIVGSRSVGWPAGEVRAINAARIAGVSEDEMRSLVDRLVAARKTAH
jgi:prophage regulatory protein